MVFDEDSDNDPDNDWGQSMNIYLMPHGEAESEEENLERPLSVAGKAKVMKCAAGIVKMELQFDAMVVSPKLRARQTAEIVAEATGFAGELVETEALKPTADPAQGIAVLAKLKGKENVLVAGHMPSLGLMVSSLLAANEEVAVAFECGGLCAVEVAELPTHGGMLLFALTPEQLELVAGV